MKKLDLIYFSLVILSISFVIYIGLDFAHAQRPDYDYTIYVQNNRTILENYNFTILDNYTYYHNDGKVFSDAMSFLQNGGKLYVHRGIYGLNNTVLHVPKYVQIQGEGLGNVGYEQTELRFTNGGNITIQEFNDIENVHLYFAAQTIPSADFIIQGGNNYLNNIFVTGNNVSTSVYLYTGSNYCANNHIGKLSIAGGYQSLRLENCTQTFIQDLEISTFQNAALFLIHSDHNHFVNTQVTSPLGGVSTLHQDLIFGAGGDNLTLGNSFDYLTLQVGDLNIVNNEQYQKRPNFIHVLGIDGPLVTANGTGTIEKLYIDYKTAN